MIYTVTFNPSLDHIIHTTNFSKPAPYIQEQTAFFPGGKGINVSRILKHLNLPSIPLGFLAGFSGEEIDQRLQEEDIHGQWIKLSSGQSRVNVKIVSTGEWELNGKGVKPNEYEFNRLIDQLRKPRLKDIVVISGSVYEGMTAFDLNRLFLSLADVPMILDMSGWALLEGLRYRPLLIKPNQYELAELSGMPTDTEDEIIKAAKFLQSKGARHVFVSRGQLGSLFVAEDGHLFQCGIADGKVVSTTGAGDSMVAGFVYGLEQGMTLEECVRFAGACSCATAFQDGLANKEAIEAVYQAMPAVKQL